MPGVALTVDPLETSEFMLLDARIRDLERAMRTLLKAPPDQPPAVTADPLPDPWLVWALAIVVLAFGIAEGNRALCTIGVGLAITWFLL